MLKYVLFFKLVLFRELSLKILEILSIQYWQYSKCFIAFNIFIPPCFLGILLMIVGNRDFLCQRLLRKTTV